MVTTQANDGTLCSSINKGSMMTRRRNSPVNRLRYFEKITITDEWSCSEWKMRFSIPHFLQTIIYKWCAPRVIAANEVCQHFSITYQLMVIRFFSYYRFICPFPWCCFSSRIWRLSSAWYSFSFCAFSSRAGPYPETAALHLPSRRYFQVPERWFSCWWQRKRLSPSWAGRICFASYLPCCRKVVF